MKIHIVKRGDTLYLLSQKYNVPLEKIIELNPDIADPNKLTIGMKVKIPSSTPSTPAGMHKHIVVQGDTLWKISKAWGVPLQSLIQANPHLKNPNMLMIGESVFIPTSGSDSGSGSHMTTMSTDTNKVFTGPKPFTGQKPFTGPVPTAAPAPAPTPAPAPEVAPVEKPAEAVQKPAEPVQKPAEPVKAQEVKPVAPVQKPAAPVEEKKPAAQAIEKSNVNLFKEHKIPAIEATSVNQLAQTNVNKSNVMQQAQPQANLSNMMQKPLSNLMMPNVVQPSSVNMPNVMQMQQEDMNISPYVQPMDNMGYPMYPTADNMMPYGGANIMPYSESNMMPYGGANIMPYSESNMMPYGGANIMPYSDGDMMPYGGSNIMPYSDANMAPYAGANVMPYGGSNIMPLAAPSMKMPVSKPGCGCKSCQEAAAIQAASQMNISPYMTSPYHASPNNISPYSEATTSNVSPYGASPSNVSPYGASPSNVSPYGASPSNVSPYSASPSNVSPYSASPNNVSPYSASPSNVSPYSASPSNVSPYSASPSNVSPYSVEPMANAYANPAMYENNPIMPYSVQPNMGNASPNQYSNSVVVNPYMYHYPQAYLHAQEDCGCGGGKREDEMREEQLLEQPVISAAEAEVGTELNSNSGSSGSTATIRVANDSPVRKKSRAKVSHKPRKKSISKRRSSYPWVNM